MDNLIFVSVAISDDGAILAIDGPELNAAANRFLTEPTAENWQAYKTLSMTISQALGLLRERLGLLWESQPDALPNTLTVPDMR